MKSFKSIVNNTDYEVKTITTHNKKRNKKFPLRYFYIDNFFTKTFWSELVNAYEELKPSLIEFSNAYDASLVHINPYENNAFSVFLSLEYKNFIENIFDDIELTENIMLELHRHKINSKSGWIHNAIDLTFSI